MKVPRLCLAFLGFWALHAHAGAIRTDPEAADFFATFAKTGQAQGHLIVAFEFGRREPCCFRRADWVEILIARNRRIPPAADAASAVPEPGAATLLTFGLLGFLVLKSKKSALTDALSKL
jgi:hypothetical protein